MVNTRPIVPFPVTAGQANYPDVENILAQLSQAVGRLISFDAISLAEEAGNAKAINAVLLGAVAKSGKVPFDAEWIRKAVMENVPEKFRATNQKAYDLGFEIGA